MNKTKLALGLVGVLAIGGMGVYGASKVSYSNGTRVGTIDKFSKKGLACKTYEGELSLKGSAVKTWKFSVPDENIASKVQDAQNAGKPVSLTYEQKFFVIPCTADTDYFITEVNSVK